MNCHSPLFFHGPMDFFLTIQRDTLSLLKNFFIGLDILYTAIFYSFSSLNTIFIYKMLHIVMETIVIKLRVHFFFCSQS